MTHPSVPPPPLSPDDHAEQPQQPVRHGDLGYGAGSDVGPSFDDEAEAPSRENPSGR